ncbi:MAG: hypothetical protein GF370_01095 [Candidatus Nealsonbacteria bacterium]|nr:hypothetical protein [Candidatus Nealsonbacteria bacterium]
MTYPGILYNTLVCFISFAASLAAFFVLRKKRKKKELGFPASLDQFLFWFGIMWFFIALRNFFAWQGRPDLDLLIFKWFAGPLTYLHIIPLFFYFGWSFFKDKRARLGFGYFFAVIILVATGALIAGGVVPGEMTYWGTDPAPNSLAGKIFQLGVILPFLACAAGETIKRLKKLKETGEVTDKKRFGFAVAFLIYFLIGVFDALGGATGWKLLLSRGGMTLVPLVIYIFATLGEE